MFLGFIATQNTDTHVLPMAEMNTFRRPPPGPDDCQVCRKPLPESSAVRPTLRLHLYCDRKAPPPDRRDLEGVGSQGLCDLQQPCALRADLPIPAHPHLRRGLQHPERTARAETRTQEMATKATSPRARAHPCAAEGVAYSTPWAGRAWNKPITGSAMLGAPAQPNPNHPAPMLPRLDALDGRQGPGTPTRGQMPGS